MSLFKALFDLSQQTGQVKNTRKAIFDTRDRLRGTPQFSEMFHSVIIDAEHPPAAIAGDHTSGAFAGVAWQSDRGAYEPYSTVKYQDFNLGYVECCAFFLLVQECYPNVYDFPNRTTTDIANGVPVELIMKKQFIGKALKGVGIPAKVEKSVPEQNGNGQRFCSNCGSKVASGAGFCSSCGSKIV